MKHERIIEAIDGLNNWIDQLEGFVSRIEDDSPTTMKEGDMVKANQLSMSEFLSGGGVDMVNKSAERVDMIHKKLSDLLDGVRDVGIDKARKENY